MSANERLGIQLYFDVADLNNQITQIKNKLQDTFGDLSKIVKSAGISDALNKDFQISNKVVKEYAKNLGIELTGSKEQVKELKKEIADLNAEISGRGKARKKLEFKDEISEIERFKKKLDEAKNKLKELQDQAARKLALQQIEATDINKQFNINKAISTGTASPWSQSISASMQNIMGNSSTKWSNDIAVQAKQAQQYLDSLSRQGLKIDNGLVVPIREVNNQLKNSAKSANDFTGSLANLFNLEARFYGVRAIIFGLTNQIREAVSTILDFDQALHDTAAIAQASGAELFEMSKAAIKIAESSKFTSTQVMEAMKIAAQSGVSAKDVPDVTKTAITLATGTGSTPDQAIKVLTTAMNVWKVEAKDSIKVANSFTAALNESKLEVGDLTTSFNYLANQASISNKSLEETNGIIATFAQMGVKASTIGTGVSGLLSTLMAPTPKLKKLLDDLGISIEEINPRFHSFADIVDRFKESGASTEQILGTFQQRIGRTMVTALNAGGDAFRQMTFAVSDTNAAFVANQEAMKGARAQLNVLKQSFVEAVKIFGENFGASLKNAMVYLNNFVTGLQTTEGQVTVAAIAVSTLIFAVDKLAVSFRALALAHPVLAAISLGLGAIITLLPLMGAGVKSSSDELKRFSNEFAESSRSTLKLRSELLDIQFKMKQAESTQDNNQREKLYETVKQKIRDLKKEYPELLAFLKEETRNQKDLAKAIDLVNRTRYAKDTGAINEYNTKVKQLEDNEKRIKELNDRLTLTKFLPGIPGSQLWKDRNEVSAKTAANAALKSELDNLRGGIPSARVKAGSRYLEQVSFGEMGKGVFGDLNFSPTNLDEGDKKGTVKSKRAIDLASERYQTKLKADIAAEQSESRKLDLEYIKDAIKDSRLQVELRKQLLDEANKIIDEEQAYNLKQAVLKASQDFANVHKNAIGFDSENNQFYYLPIPTDKEEKKIFEKAKSVYLSDYKDYVEYVTVTLPNRFKTKGNLEKDKITDLVLGMDEKDNALRLVSDNLEKQADRNLRIRQADLSLQQQQAHTAEEVRDINIQLTEAQLENSRAKKEAYELDVKNLENWLYNAKETDINYEGNLEKLNSIQDKHSSIVQLIKEQNSQLATQKDSSFGVNFSRGMDRAVKGFGTPESRTEELGFNITNTLESSTENAVNGMVDALAKGENAWRSFKEGIGNILGDIAKELQKYIIKMMVVYTVQKLIGVAMSNTGLGGWAAGSGWGSNIEGSSNFVGPVQPNGGGFIVGKGKLLKFDTGGQVPLNIGVPNKDSVPAWLTPGEVVIQKPAVDFYGVNNLLKLNAMKFAEGGLVGRASLSKNSGKDSGLEGAVLQIINLVDPNSIPQTSDTQIINVINLDIAKRGPTYKTIKLVQQGN